jgi:hypothetical protein
MQKRLLAVFGLLLLVFTVSIPSAQAAPGNVRGYELNNSGYNGLRALMSAGTAGGSPPNFYFPAKSPDVNQEFIQQLYPKNSPLKIELRHSHVAGSGTTQNRLYFLTLCDGTTGYYDLADSTVRGAYVKQVSYNDTGMAFTDEVVDVRIYNTSGSTWVAQIYNNILSTYQTIYTKSCSRTELGYVDILDNGYTQDATMACPTLYPWGILQIRGIQKLSGGVWSLISAGDITYYAADNWPCINTNNYMVTNPYVFQIKLLPYGVGY